MKKIFHFIGFWLFPLALIAQNGKDNLDLGQIFSSPTFFPKGVPEIKMMEDGRYYTQSDFDSKRKNSVILKFSFTKHTAADTLFKGYNIPALQKGFNLEDYEISRDGKIILLQTNSTKIYRHSTEAEFFIWNVAKKSLTQVYEGKKVSYASLSPDATKVAFVYKNNLFIQNVNDGKLTQLTNDGEINKIINGKTDWVYEEEFALVEAFFWSPDGDKIAFYRFDESKVKEYQLPVYDSAYPTQYKYKYPKAGEDNSEVSIWIYDVKTNNKKKLELNEKNDQYIPRIEWTSDNNVLSVQRLNRLQNHLEILFADANSGALTKIYEEKNDTYIEITDNLVFLDDNSFVLTSDKEGFDQVYLYDKNGKLIRKLTPWNFDVNEIIGVDEKKKLVYYNAFDPSPLVKNVYSVKLSGGDKMPLVKDQDGQNNAKFSNDFSYFIFTNSSVTKPTNVAIYNIKGKKLRILQDNEALRKRVEEMKLPAKEFIKIPVSDSVSLNAWMIKPSNFNPANKYPVVVSIYGGPGSQTVKNEWGGAMDMWYHYLGQNGIIVVSVDNRGTGGRGAAFKKVTYKNLGKIESDDQIAAAKYLGSLPYIDGSRIGINGWSFGGYLSSLCLMKGSDAFKLSTSVAPVTDWRYYDNIYTERYMQRPVDNMKGYDETSIMSYVNKLRGKYLVIHGTFDDNVHPQNTFELLEEMVRQNKKFDSEFYTNKNHSIYGGFTRLHLYTRITDFILQNL